MAIWWENYGICPTNGDSKRENSPINPHQWKKSSVNNGVSENWGQKWLVAIKSSVEWQSPRGTLGFSTLETRKTTGGTGVNMASRWLVDMEPIVPKLHLFSIWGQKRAMAMPSTRPHAQILLKEAHSMPLQPSWRATGVVPGFQLQKASFWGAVQISGG